MRLSSCLFIRLSVCLHPFVRLSALLSVFQPSVYLNVYLSVYLSAYLSVYLSVSLSLCLSVCLYACLSIYMFVCMYVCLHPSFVSRAHLSEERI